MDKVANRVLGHAAMLGLWALGTLSGLGVMMGAASASPPASQKVPPRLDLRPSTSMVAAEKTSAIFPSALHRRTLDTQDQFQIPAQGALGAEGPQARTPGRIEEFARRVHREGLPVARLWENKSALVSLGFNQKGKPGLWIIQKIH